MSDNCLFTPKTIQMEFKNYSGIGTILSCAANQPQHQTMSQSSSLEAVVAYKFVLFHWIRKKEEGFI
jgi:hypothetical protein